MGNPYDVACLNDSREFSGILCFQILDFDPEALDH